jgi:hypothetical protein
MIVCRSEPQIVAAVILPNISPSSISGMAANSLSKRMLGPWKITLWAAVDVAASEMFADSILLGKNADGKTFAEFDN